MLLLIAVVLWACVMGWCLLGLLGWFDETTRRF